MRAYRKELNNLEELRRERIRIKAELKHSSAIELLNPFSKASGTKNSSKANNGIWGTISGVLSADNQLQTGVALGKQLLKMLRKRKEKANANFIKGDKKKDSILAGIAKEVIVGYLIGKAVQLSFKGIKALIRKKKKA
ncbi:MAG: hypothetical protein ABI378_10520 [Chitinophagaceae bacterium]